MRSDRLSRYDEVRLIHLEPTARCQAACPMCGRNIAGGRKRDCVTEDEISLAQFRDWLPRDLLARLEGLFMCGNFGEPIMARDCLEMYETCRSASSTISLGLNTNGSARKPEFWRDLAGLGVRVKFGIDGATAASHLRYRRHTDFDRILENARHFIAAGGRAVWDYLVFRHNEAEVETAREMARRMGFAGFVVKETERFYDDHFAVQDADGVEVDRLEPVTTWRRRAADAPRDPERCGIACQVAERGSVFVSASGLVFPCCYLGQLIHERPGAPDSWFDLPSRREDLSRFFAAVDRIGQGNLDLRQRSLRDIVDRSLPEFARRWGVGPERLLTCGTVCGVAQAAVAAR